MTAIARGYNHRRKERRVTRVKNKDSRSRRRIGVVLLYLLIDILVIFFSFYFVYLARFEGPALFRFPPALFQARVFSKEHFLIHLQIAALMGLFLIVVMYKNGLYATSRGARFSDEFVAVANAVLLTLLFGMVMSFLLQWKTISRLVLGGFTSLLLPSLVGWRVLKRKWLEYLIAHGYRRTGALIVGAGKIGRYLEKSLKDHAWLGIDVLGFLDDKFRGQDQGQGQANPHGDRILGALSDFKEVAGEQKVQDVYITIPSEREKVKALIEEAYELGINVHIVPDLFNLLIREVEFENVGSLTLLRLFKPTLDGWERLLKRMEDLVVAVVLLIIFSPVMAAIALAIKLDSPGPVIYKQLRHGKDGKPFWFYKFRSMYADVDDAKHRALAKQLIKTNNPVDEKRGLYKLAEDERITPVGRIIRKFNLDEIPQLWNVIRGEMALVGPRPPLPYEYEEYEEYYKKRLAIKPGITGLWQVSGLHKLSFEEMVALDLRYINEWSLWLDIKILLETIPVVLFGKGV